MVKNIGKIKMIVDTEFEEHRFASFFDKEPETIDWIKTFKSNEIFFDIGANIGVFSLFAASLLKEIKVYSFEPVYHNFDKLCRNVLVNEYNNFVTPYCLAIGDENKADIINIVSNVSGSANHFMIEDSEKNVEFKQGVFTSSLDKLVDCGLPVPNHIKIDVDGYEERIIQGAEETIINNKVKSVLIEITDTNNSKERIVNMMKTYGFNTECPINFQKNHSKVRRIKSGNNHIENIIFTKN
jgi:FkbM family methyltransferase